ncbi:M16 family metallopeptidase [Marinitenerispora sediminis]|uniref:Peptidase M16 n=1 Tax=Marinitenerispora sediminis TaxID=1931232 RepID=A0A368T4X9_9ACTN|nr:pitrilysin family protein [Marinitenerispora sediminis]RCV53088.1 peptidase M16 [Marinitenerispora sediminis]RCV58542.1 peptidase M16 [Marinitenerispora sediminis]RCV58665.1 peptidase M16 [Marinitenerispora sediminis]
MSAAVPIAADQEPDTTVTLEAPGDGAGLVRRTVLPGGLRVVTETMPGVRSAAFGISATTGSRDEDAAHAGSAHFLEHLLFKGTARRDALEISAQLDGVGADYNAYTTKEQTSYYAKVLDRDLPLAIDVVSDMVANSVLDPDEVETERGVILEEIAMYEDEPSDLVDDVFAAHVFGAAPLGRPVLGTNETIKALPRDRIFEQYRECYLPNRLVVAAAGNLDHDDVVRRVRAAFEPQLAAAGDARPVRPRIGGPAVPVNAGSTLLSRDTEQAHLILGSEGLTRTDDRWYALKVLASVLGGGSSSRLFQEVREKRGLAYAVHAYPASYADTGIFQVYVGCLPEKIDEVLSVCRGELAKAAAEGITDAELARAKGQIRGSWVLGTEGTNSRMSRLTQHELSYPRHYSLDEDLALFDAVTMDDVREVAADVLGRPHALAVIGPYEEDRVF